MPPKAGESDLLGQDDVHRAPRGAGFAQQVFPLLANELAVLGVGHPRLTAAKEHDARRAQDHQAGEQGQHAEADELAVGGEDAGGAGRLLEGDLQRVSLGRPEELPEGVSVEGVVLRRQRKHSVVHRPDAHRRGPGLRSVPQGARGTREPLVANAPEGAAGPADARPPVGAGPAGAGREAGAVTGGTGEAERTDAGEGRAAVGAVAPVEAGVGPAAVRELTEVSG